MSYFSIPNNVPTVIGSTVRISTYCDDHLQIMGEIIVEFGDLSELDKAFMLSHCDYTS